MMQMWPGQIHIQVVPISQMRYRTVGDWYYPNLNSKDILVIRIADTGDPRWNYLLIRHEINEAMMCAVTGISQAEVDTFDMKWDDADGEAGASNQAPYVVAHMLAYADEINTANAQAIDWNKYEMRLDELMKEYDDFKLKETDVISKH
ncbi:MAG: hypothetical protein WA766_13640 [Candidatus Acidiferrales bacterium]